MVGRIYFSIDSCNRNTTGINLNQDIHFAKLKVIHLIPQPLIGTVGKAAVQATSNCGDSTWTSDMANVMVRCEDEPRQKQGVGSVLLSLLNDA